ncbi:zinc-binding dehydrogenase [Microbacterium sp. QXD-8]|uniref:Zinc-binding dehydrogenase n=1 Tax=Microbacterium psychrotolerans TaxID=3068321 RepID=A0ABU0YW24_9MICO|nr:zinc-binding dehydrogenase [Microbacterium sp. QXD-8]MDQ7876512.1 zinc-binding dehydrogenase [Microbacterium sp. QXD-8]
MMPAQMRAVVHMGRSGPAGLVSRLVPTPAAQRGEVVIALAYAGLNRHDVFVMDARGKQDPPLVLGSDGAGVIVDVGAGVSRSEIGRRVMINPCIGWDDARDVPTVPEILGDPRWGTLAEFVAIPACNVATPPPHLSDREAAALGLAGMTAYRALFTIAALRPTDHLLIPAIAGGVALLALSFARAVGARVTVTSRRPAMLERAIELGATDAILTDSEWSEAMSAPVDCVLDTIGAPSFERAVRALRPGGRLVSVGATAGADAALDLRDLFFRQISISGTSMASAPEFDEMVRFVAQHEIRPVIGATYDLARADRALGALASHSHFGKIVVSIVGDDGKDTSA